MRVFYTAKIYRQRNWKPDEANDIEKIATKKKKKKAINTRVGIY